MMRATLEATTDGILVTDGHGKVTDFNEQFVRMWQLPREVLDTREHRHLAHRHEPVLQGAPPVPGQNGRHSRVVAARNL